MWIFRFLCFSRFHSIIITVNHVRLELWLLLQLFQLCHCSLSLRLRTIGLVFDAWQMKLKLSKCVIHFTIAVKPLVRIKTKGFNRIESKYSVCRTNTFRTLSLSIKRLPSIYSNLNHKTWPEHGKNRTKKREEKHTHTLIAQLTKNSNNCVPTKRNDRMTKRKRNGHETNWKYVAELGNEMNK